MNEPIWDPYMEKVSRVAGDMQPQKAPNPQKALRFWESGCRFQDSGCRFQESGCAVSQDPQIFSMSGEGCNPLMPAQ